MKSENFNFKDTKVVKTKYGTMYLNRDADAEDVKNAIADLDRKYGARGKIEDSAKSDTETNKRKQAKNTLPPDMSPPQSKQDKLQSGSTLLTPATRVPQSTFNTGKKEKRIYKTGSEDVEKVLLRNPRGFFSLPPPNRNKQIDDAVQRAAAYDQSLGTADKQTPQSDYRNDATSKLSKEQRKVYSGAGIVNDYLGPEWISDQDTGVKKDMWSTIADTIGTQVTTLKIAAAAAGGLAAAWLLFAPDTSRRR
jgi:hypothetical protein